MSPRAWSLLLLFFVVNAFGFSIFAGVKISAEDAVLVVLCMVGREVAMMREGD